MNAENRNILTISSLAVLAASLAGGVFFAYQQGYIHDIIETVRSDISPLLFIILMIILPLVGFPISAFLIIAGIKFGILLTFALLVCVLPLHTTITYTVAKYLRPLLLKLLHHTLGYKIPAIPKKNQAMYSFLFLAIPGIPYAAKNYLLPFAGVSFRYCVVMNSIIQSILGLPFIVLWKSGADQDPTLFYAAILSLVALFVIIRLLKRKYSNS